MRRERVGRAIYSPSPPPLGFFHAPFTPWLLLNSWRFLLRWGPQDISIGYFVGPTRYFLRNISVGPTNISVGPAKISGFRRFFPKNSEYAIFFVLT